MRKTIITLALMSGTLVVFAVSASTQLISRVFNFYPHAVKIERPTPGFPRIVPATNGLANYIIPKFDRLPVTVIYIINRHGQGCAYTFEYDKSQTQNPPYGYKITAQGVRGFDGNCKNDTGVLTIN